MIALSDCTIYAQPITIGRHSSLLTQPVLLHFYADSASATSSLSDFPSVLTRIAFGIAGAVLVPGVSHASFETYALLCSIGEGFVSRLGAQGLLVYFVKAWGVVVSMVTRFRL